MAETRSVLVEIGAVAKSTIKKVLGTIEKRLKSIGRSAKDAISGALGTALNTAKYAAVAVGVGLTAAVYDAKQFSAAMTEVSTLVDTSTVNMQGMTNELLALSKETGRAPQELADGLYEAISAGLSAADAMAFLTVSTKGAIGGVAATDEAVDHLTNVMNAYGLSASGMARVSDITFKTIQEGKTTYSELANSMGTVLPAASDLGVELEDLFAATATLTKGGIETRRATTYLRGAMMAVLKPTEEAKSLAAELGIEFNKQAVASMGLQKWLAMVTEKTKDQADAMPRLFSSQEAYTAMSALAGKQSAEFARILGELKNATGSAETAFNKIAGSPSERMDRSLNRIRLVGTEIGLTVLPVVAEVLETVSGAFERLRPAIQSNVDAFMSWYDINEELISGAVTSAVDGLSSALRSMPEYLKSAYEWAKQLYDTLSNNETIQYAIEGTKLILDELWNNWLPKGLSFGKDIAGFIVDAISTSMEWIKKVLADIGETTVGRAVGLGDFAKMYRMEEKKKRVEDFAYHMAATTLFMRATSPFHEQTLEQGKIETLANIANGESGMSRDEEKKFKVTIYQEIGSPEEVARHTSAAVKSAAAEQSQRFGASLRQQQTQQEIALAGI